MNNQQYDNKFSDGVLVIVGTLVRTIERAIVVFWDGLRNATEHGTPSLLGFIAAVLPALTPLPVAAMTANSLTQFLVWQPWQAITMAAAIECIGFVVWVSLTEELMRGGWRGTVMQYFFAASAVIYQALLIAANSILAAQAGAQNTYVLILALLSVLPALSSVAYGYRNIDNARQLEREQQAAEALAEKIRQERREDRKQAQALKMQYAAETEAVKLKDKSFRK